MYDESGKPQSIYYNNGSTTSKYYFIKNLQGDVVQLRDYHNNLVAKYIYDPWGKVVSITDADGNQITSASHIANINPIRYRGYYYDTETGLYYVSSRYYDPEIGRWISADSQLNSSLGVLGCNLYAYCLNNPVNKVDYSGNKPGDLFDTMDEAARDFAMIYAQLGYEYRAAFASFIYSKTVREIHYYQVPTYRLSVKFSWERGFLFYYKPTGFKTISYPVKVTKYSYVRPNQGSEGLVSMPINWFGTKKKVAEIHNHTWIPGHHNDKFSPGDLNNWINYVSTPSGTLRKYDPNNISSESDGAITIYWDTPVDPNGGT